MDRIVITLDPISVEQKRLLEANTNFFSTMFLMIFYIVVLSLIILIYVLYTNNYAPFVVLKDYNAIVRSINTYSILVDEITSQESKENHIKFNATTKFNRFTCIDMGSYYVSVMLNNEYLPTFIRRGNGDIWRVSKAAAKDDAALQFCNYISTAYMDNYITCGNDMFKKIGISGYLDDTTSDCNMISNILYQKI